MVFKKKITKNPNFIILYWFCHTLTWIHHRCTCVPKHEPASHLPPHNISLGHHRAPAPSMLYPASDIDWRFDSYMIVYMLQCHSPKSSHLLPLPLSCGLEVSIGSSVLFIYFFKFLFLLYFTLQYCIGFAIHWHESTTGVQE